MKNLEFVNCKQITNNALKQLPEKLVSLNINFCTQMTDQGMKYLSERTKGLKFLKMVSLSRVNDEGLQYLSTLKTLKSLNLTNCTNLTEKGLSFLQNTGLKHLSLTNLKLKSGLDKLPSLLKSLDLTNTPFNDDSLKLLKNFKFLSHLDLSYCYKMNGESLSKLPLLTSLSLFGWKNLEDAHLKGIPSSLEFLDLSYCELITENSFKFLPFTSLKTLILRECKAIKNKKKKNISHCKIIF